MEEVWGFRWNECSGVLALASSMLDTLQSGQWLVKDGAVEVEVEEEEEEEDEVADIDFFSLPSLSTL
jgi:hypothetical protein